MNATEIGNRHVDRALHVCFCGDVALYESNRSTVIRFLRSTVVVVEVDHNGSAAFGHNHIDGRAAQA